MKIRAYTLAVHVGHAPCWMFDTQQDREVLSLANCKPRIRDAAALGEWIAGVTPKAMGCRLAYLMQVGERLTRTEYWARYQRSRHDSIYKPLAQEAGSNSRIRGMWMMKAESTTFVRNGYSLAQSSLYSQTATPTVRMPHEACNCRTSIVAWLAAGCGGQGSSSTCPVHFYLGQGSSGGSS